MRKLSEINLQERDRQAVEKAVSILKKDFPVTEVFLFGSKARGDDDAESDIDLLVLTSQQITWQERNKMTDALFDVQLKYGVVISLLVVPFEKWKRGILIAHPIHDIIEEEGVTA